MTEDPYRTTDPESPEPPPAPGLELLGPLRRTFTPPPHRRPVLVGLAWSTLVMLALGLVMFLATDSLVLVLVFLVPAYACMLALFCLPAWLARNLRVELHAIGLLVSRGSKRTIVPFDDVDELWMVLERTSSWVMTRATIVALRLVLHSGRTHRVPMGLQECDELMRAVITHCSHPLGVSASKALKAGETLTFGRVKIDRVALSGRFWKMRWADVRLVRDSPGRLSFFTWQPIVPRRVIGLDQVPHPTVFAKLVKQCAPRFDEDTGYGPLME